MDDIVAVRVRLREGESRFFLTWGRIQDAVDPAPLQALVLREAKGFDLGGEPLDATLCPVRDATAEPWFFEAFFHLANERIPYGWRYRGWRRKKALRMEKGQDLHFLGK